MMRTSAQSPRIGRIWLVVFALLILALVVHAKEKPPGFDSPEQAFRAYITGAITEDFDLMLSALTRESQAYHTGLAVFSLTYLFQKDECEKLLRDHGVSTEATANQKDEHNKRDGATVSGKEESKECDDTVFIDAMLKIKNPGQLMRTVCEREDEVSKLFAKANSVREKTKEPTKKNIIESVLLKDIRIAKDTATGRVELLQPAKAINALYREKEVKFRRIKRRWYCDIDPR
jgi:hypothetical protein